MKTSHRLIKAILFISAIILLSLNATESRAAGHEVRVYRGTSSYTSDVICTVRDGKIYKGTSNYTSDILCTLRDGSGSNAVKAVYRGTSNYSSDILFTTDGYLTLAEFMAVLHCFLYVY